MSQLSKNQLKAENQSQFPNNNVGAITPSHLRAFNVDMIDSTVNQTDFTNFSGSVAGEIDTLQAEVAALENVSASLITSASNALTTASFDNGTRDLTFTKGNGSTFALNIPASTIDTGSFVTTSSFDAFSQSVDSRLDNIEAATSSFITSAQTASMTVLSASFATTAAFALNSTTVNTGSLVTTASFNAYTSSTNNRLNNLETTTASINTSITNINSFTTSANSRLNAIESVSSSWITESETGSFARTDVSNIFTQNNSFLQNVSIAGNLYVSGSEVIVSSSTLIVGDRIIEVNANRVIGDAGIYAFDAIGDQTGSLIWNPNVDYWLAGLSGSETRVITAADTASMLSPYITAAQTSSMTVLSASFALTAAFALNSTQIDTGSFITTSSFNPFSASVDSRLDNLEAATSSYITSAQTSSLSVENALTASIARNLIVIARNGGASTLPAGTVVHITSAVGDNPIFTTASYDTEALSSNTFGLLRYSSPSGADVEVVVAGVVTGVDTDPALGYVAGDIVYLSSSGQFTRVQPQAPNQIVTLGQVLRAQQNNGSIYVSINNGWELDELHNVQITSPQTGDIIQYESASYGLWKNKSISGAGILSTSSFNAATGAFATTGSNTFIGTETISGSLIVTGSVGIQISGAGNTGNVIITGSGYTWIDMQNSSRTASLRIGGPDSNTTYRNRITLEGMQELNVNYTNNVNFTYTGASGDANIQHYGNAPHINWRDTTTNRIYKIKNSGSVFSINEGLSLTDVAILEMTTSSVKVSGSSVDIQGTLTASLQQGFTYVGGANGRTTLVATASFATTGSNAFFGNNTFSGSLAFTGSAINLLSASTSGTVITNLTDTFTDVSRVEQIVTLTSASYAALVTGSLTNPNTLYIVSGSTSGSGGGTGVGFPFTGSAEITGSLIVTGSMRGNVRALTIASNTASIDFGAANYFTITLPTSSTTHFTATNIQPGLSATLVVTTGTGGTGATASFSPSFLQPFGFGYQPTSGSAKRDVLSFVTVDTGSVYVVSTQNMV